MNFKTLLMLSAALCVCTEAFAAGKIRLAPGASCFAWNQNTKSKPDAIPAGGFVDESNRFFWRNIHQCDELKNLNGASFIRWEGYLQVPKTQNYRFSLTTHGYADRDATIKIFLNSQPLLTKQENGSDTVTASASLKRGFVHIRIYLNPNRPNSEVSFSLKYAGINAMKMTDIIPSGLYHKVDEEQ